MRLCAYHSISLFGFINGAMISLTLPGDPPAGVPTSPPLTETPQGQGQNVGVIAGAAVAAFVVLSSLIGAFFWYRRRQRVRSKPVEPVPLATTNTNLSATTSRPPPLLDLDTRTAVPLARPTIPTPSRSTAVEVPAKAEYRGNNMSSVFSGSGSSGLAYSSPRGRNIPSTMLSPRSHLTTTTTTTATAITPMTATTALSHSPPRSPHPLLPPPSYAAAASDLQIHEIHEEDPDSE